MDVLSQLLGWPAPVRLIGWEEALRPAGGQGHQVVCACAGPLSIAHKEPVGVAFHTKVLQQQGLFQYPEESSDDDQSRNGTDGGAERGMPSHASSASLESDQPPPGVSWKGTKRRKEKKKKEGQDLYALLGLGNERWTATEAQLKNAYRRVCLEHHPDKRLAGVTDDSEKTRIEDYFKQIQEAYAVLSDPTKRREYDSVDEFDDSLPMECASADFYKVFGPAFRRNARWSSADGPVPDLGDATTPWTDVERFYAFWFTFRSWREFPHPDEEDVEGAESREHRRWIERQNSKLREKGKKEEGRRLREFVDAAYRQDPRVVARKEEERAEKERRRAEKEEARRRAEAEEAARQAEEAAAAARAEAEAKRAADEAKKAREALKKAQKKERQRLRMICDASAGYERLITEDEVDQLTKLPLEKLQALCESLSAFGLTRDDQRGVALASLDDLLGVEAAEAARKERAKREAEASLKNLAKKDHHKKLEAMREWDEEELRLLDKAVVKFPQGTPKRWEAVAAYIRTRTLDEVLLMVKERQGMSATRVKAQEDFRGAAKKRAEVQSTADQRLSAFTDVNINLVGDAAAQLLGPAAATTDKPAAPQPASANGSKPAAAPGPSSTPAAAPPAPAAVVEAKKKVVSADSGEWSEQQEVALVKALKQFGKELGQERWERVAEQVPGKTKAQCFKRFKELREVFRARKGGGPGGEGDE